MDVPTVAVTGVAGLIGQRLVPRLRRDDVHVVGIDVRMPPQRTRGVDVRLVDVTRADLAPVLRGVDVLVHLAAVVDPIPDEALMTRVNVEGTRRVLAAASTVGVRKVVRVSSAAAYGAWSTNPVPLREDATLRPNPGFSPGIHATEVERLLAEWRDDHPDATVTILRAAPVLGPGAERLPSRLLLGRPRLRVRGCAPPVQAAHVDDLVAALELVIGEDHPGAFNVACDGWLEADAARALLPRSVLPALPAHALARALRATWSVGLGEIPPGVVPYLVHPWVVANDRLRALGWRPQHSNAEAIADGLASIPVRGIRRRRASRGRAPRSTHPTPA